MDKEKAESIVGCLMKIYVVSNKELDHRAAFRNIREAIEYRKRMMLEDGVHYDFDEMWLD